MALTEELVREELKKVVDPELFVNIVDLGLVYVVELVRLSDAEQGTDSTATVSESSSDGASSHSHSTDYQATDGVMAGGDSPVEDGADSESTDSAKTCDIVIDMTMTSPACPAGPQLIANSKQVVGRIPGVRNVEVRIVMDPPWTPDRMTDEARDQLGIF